jgi:hypothetical protein
MWDEEGLAVRDFDSTTYTGAIETAEQFGKRLYVKAQKKVVIGDGAEWIWNLAQQDFPGAVQIVHLYHASTCGNWSACSIPGDRKLQNAWIRLHQKR